MSDFYVDLAVLPGLAEQLRRHGEYALTGRSYVQSRTALHGVEGWLNKLGDAHEMVVDTTMRWLREVDNPLAVMSAERVDRTVETYRETDKESAARLDAQLPANGSLLDIPPQDGEDAFNWGHSWLGAFDDALDPEDCCRPIPDYSQDERYAFHPAWSDVSDSGSLTRKLVWEATSVMAGLGWIDQPVDMYRWAYVWIAGDWAGFRGCTDVFRNLADAVGSMAGNLHRTQVMLPEVWRGNAADSCNVHIGRIRQALKDAEDPLRTLADRYEEAAEGQAHFRVLITPLLDELASAAANLLLAAVLPAPLIAAINGSRVIRAIEKIISIRDDVGTIMAGVDSALRDFGQLQAPDYSLPKLPEVTGGHSTLDDLPSEWRP